MSNTLDITHFKERGKRLDKKIKDTVNAKDAFILVPPPSELHMTLEQYYSLLGEDVLENMVKYSKFTDTIKPDKNKMFYTGKYVLEVKVKE